MDGTVRPRWLRGYQHYNGIKELVHRITAQFRLGLRWKRNDRSTYVCHHCDQPGCFNPQHLYVGNARTNAEDRKLAETMTLEERQAYRNGRATEGDMNQP
jgi:hypothetical protein